MRWGIYSYWQLSSIWCDGIANGPLNAAFENVVASLEELVAARLDIEAYVIDFRRLVENAIAYRGIGKQT